MGKDSIKTDSLRYQTIGIKLTKNYYVFIVQVLKKNFSIKTYIFVNLLTPLIRFSAQT